MRGLAQAVLDVHLMTLAEEALADIALHPNWREGCPNQNHVHLEFFTRVVVEAQPTALPGTAPGWGLSNAIGD